MIYLRLISLFNFLAYFIPGYSSKIIHDIDLPKGNYIGLLFPGPLKPTIDCHFVKTILSTLDNLGVICPTKSGMNTAM